MAKWIDKPGLSAGQLSDGDKVLIGDVSQAVGSRDATATLGALRTFLGAGVVVGVTQVAHGLTVGQAIRHDGSAYVAANAATEPAARVVGVVTSVPDADTFTYQSTGFVTGLSGLTPGATYYLQDDGSLGTGLGTVARPVLIAVSSSQAVLVIHLAGIANTYYDLQMGFAGQPDAGAADLLIVARNVTVYASSPGSVYVGTNPTAPATIGVERNGVNVGEIEIAANGTVTWDLASDISLDAGDRIALVAPDPADASLADVIVALRGEAA